MAASPIIKAAPAPAQTDPAAKPATNIDVAKAIPRTPQSMPGRYPGRVVSVSHPQPVVDGQPQAQAAYQMLERAMYELTGQTNLKDAWMQFIGPDDVVGLKVNPIGGKLLTTSHAITHAVIRQLEEAGLPRQNIVIWDRRRESLDEAGFTPQEYPGIQIESTEYYDDNKSYYNDQGRLYSEDRVDHDHFLWADVEGEYDAYTLPYMVNGGKHSYFTKICTRKVTKIINMPVMKNAGTSITVCMKNLGFGAITNTQRLHTALWHETSAYVCAFPPIRDKVVLNIADGLIGCFDGGPAANPQFICQYNTILVGTDPVAVDRVAYDIIMQKRYDEGVQKAERKGARTFLDLAQELQLGVADRDAITLNTIAL